MIAGLDHLLESTGQPGLAELRRALADLLGGADAAGRLIEHVPLKAANGRVHRVLFEQNGCLRSWIAKRLEPGNARRNELVARRWLPAVGLADHGPGFVAAAGAFDGRSVWHVYEDFGDGALETRKTDEERVKLAVELIASVHTRFARHPLLGQCREHGGDLGSRYYQANLNDARYSLEAVRPPKIPLSPEQTALRDRLLAWVHRQLDEYASRAAVFEECAGPETLLHGDLWTTNIFVIQTPQGQKARLIDWDHTAVGPVSYDISMFLLRFEPRERPRILDYYREAVAESGWRLPSAKNLNVLLGSAECARTLNYLVWPTIALVQDRAEWAVGLLEQVDQWIEAMRPVLPETEEPKIESAVAA